MPHTTRAGKEKADLNHRGSEGCPERTESYCREKVRGDQHSIFGEGKEKKIPVSKDGAKKKSGEKSRECPISTAT